MVIFHGYVSHNQMVTLINGSSTMERYRHGSMVSFFFRVPGYGGVAGGTLRRAEGDASLGLGGAEESRAE